MSCAAVRHSLFRCSCISSLQTLRSSVNSVARLRQKPFSLATFVTQQKRRPVQDPLMCTLGRSTPGMLEHFRYSRDLLTSCWLPLCSLPGYTFDKETASSWVGAPVKQPGNAPPPAGQGGRGKGKPRTQSPHRTRRNAPHRRKFSHVSTFGPFDVERELCNTRLPTRPHVFQRDGPAFRHTLLLPRQHLPMAVDLLGVLPVHCLEHARTGKGNVLFLSKERKASSPEISP